MEGPSKDRTDAEDELRRAQEKRDKAPDTRGDWYGDDKPYEDELTKDEIAEVPNQKAIDEEKEELKDRRPE